VAGSTCVRGMFALLLTIPLVTRQACADERTTVHQLADQFAGTARWCANGRDSSPSSWVPPVTVSER
jgi:hypothetical protein